MKRALEEKQINEKTEIKSKSQRKKEKKSKQRL